mmetsp:Transcript_28284/g.53168  ORF Transcript_28284/g.53168 Transcript_28284/m.53168 type:complete len:406 (+) Transcript_28284:352-1569(+)
MILNTASNMSGADDRNYPFKKPFAPVKYKKAPQAPRRFKSSYMFFSTYKHKQIREDLAKKGDTSKPSTTEVAKMVSQAWKDLTEEEREKWEEMGRKDKARYEMEKSMYSGPWKVPATGKRDKDPTRPKRPMSAFLSYSEKKRSIVKAQNREAKTAEISRILAQMWKDAPEEEKKEFIDEEYRLRQDYKVAMAEWKKRTDDEFKKNREARENEAMKLVLEGKLPPDPFPLTSATTLPKDAEYHTKMAEDTFTGARQGQANPQQLATNPGYGAAAAAASGYPGIGAAAPVSGAANAAAAAAFLPPFHDSTRRHEHAALFSNPLSYGGYMQPFHYAYVPAGYPAGYPAYHPPPHFAAAAGPAGPAPAGATPGAPVGSDAPQQPQMMGSVPFPPYYQYDPNQPFRPPPF